MNRIKAFYLGYDIESVILINSKLDFELIGVAAIPELQKTSSWNLADYVFIQTYHLHKSNSQGKLNSVFSFIINILSCFMSCIYHKYTPYLQYLIKNKISIFDEEDIPKIKSLDVLIVNNWWKISSDILRVPKFGCVNMHPSRLPAYRGSLPTLWSLKNKDKSSAVSFFIINNQIDTGAIISQHEFSIEEKDNSIDLEHKIERIVNKYMMDDIISYIHGEIIPFSQNNEKASYTAKYYDYMNINFDNECCQDIINKVILYPYLNPLDACYFKYKSRKIAIRGAQISSLKLPSGFLVAKGLNLYVGCKDSTLKIRLLKDVTLFNSIFLILSINGKYRTKDYSH